MRNISTLKNFFCNVILAIICFDVIFYFLKIFFINKVENFTAPIVICDSMMLIIKMKNIDFDISWEKKAMNLAKNYLPAENPIDTVERILNRQSYAPERRSLNEVVVEVQGKWDDMLVFFSWEASMNCLHISCLMNIEHPDADTSKIFKLLAIINDDLWVGHFSYWSEQQMPVYRHSLFCNSQNPDFAGQIGQIIDIAVKECERMYPVFKVVFTKGMDPQQALYPLMLETAGQA